jgi:hypothetical protein
MLCIREIKGAFHLFVARCMKTVAYLRISTGSQDLANQKLAVLDYARQKQFGYDKDSRQNGPLVPQCHSRQGFARNDSSSQCGLGKKPTPISVVRRVAMLSSQSGGNPELSSLSGRTQRASRRRQNIVEMPVFG